MSGACACGSKLFHATGEMQVSCTVDEKTGTLRTDGLVKWLTFKSVSCDECGAVKPVDDAEDDRLAGELVDLLIQGRESSG